MKIDMANFALSKNRGTIENYSAQIEREEFMKTLEIDPSWYCFVFELLLKNFNVTKLTFVNRFFNFLTYSMFVFMKKPLL